MNEQFRDGCPVCGYPAEAGHSPKCTQNSNADVSEDEFGIERRADKKLSADSATQLLPKVLKNPHLAPFFGLSPEAVQQALSAADFFRQVNMGLNPATPSAEVLKAYSTALNKLKDCPATEPYFVVQDEGDEQKYYFCLDTGVEKEAVKYEGKYYIIANVEIDPSAEEDIESRLQQIRDSQYFPEVKLFKNKDGKFILGAEFIPHTGKVERGEDISDFVAFCRELNFGPDTNVTNFVRNKERLVYIDGDLIDWAVNPADHGYAESKHYLKSKTW